MASAHPPGPSLAFALVFPVGILHDILHLSREQGGLSFLFSACGMFKSFLRD